MEKESVVDRHCKGCRYYSNITGDLQYCSYFFQTNKRRPCPAGKGCTVKKRGRPKKGGIYENL